jgi:stage V sporulation protein G
MNITEVRVKITGDRSDKLQAFCSITIDNGFVIRDLKIIEGAKGPFVAMPSRKLTDRCPKCGGKNHLRAAFCNDCGLRLGSDRAPRDEQGRAKLHADVAHPINSETRDWLQRLILDAYRSEVERSKLPGYVAPKLYEDDDYSDEFEPAEPARRAEATSERGAPAKPEDGFSKGILI